VPIIALKCHIVIIAIVADNLSNSLRQHVAILRHFGTFFVWHAFRNSSFEFENVIS